MDWKFDTKIGHLEVLDNSILINGEEIFPQDICSVRKIFFFGNYVIKFDVDGWNQSELEVLAWDNILPEHKKYFVPLVDYKIGEYYSFVIQKLILPEERIRPSIAMEKELAKIIMFYNLEDVAIGSRHNCFFTMSGGKIYDYGEKIEPVG